MAEPFSADVRLRPFRIGLLAEPGQRNEILKFIRLCTCLWGGGFNPIIPVLKRRLKNWYDYPSAPVSRRDISLGYLNFFEPDVLVEASPGLANWLGLKDIKIDFSLPRIIPITDFVESEENGEDRFAFGEPVEALYQDLFRREYQFEARFPRRIARFDVSTDTDEFFSIVCGAFPESGVACSVSQAHPAATIEATLSRYRQRVVLIPDPEDSIKKIQQRLP